MKKKVLIVEPVTPGANVFSFYSYLPLLGTLYMGTLLKQNGFDVRVLNENVLRRKLGASDLNADYLLLSCLTNTVERGYELAQLFKQLNPEGRVIIGGPHVTFIPEEAAEFVDHVVMGEGEPVIVDLLKWGSDEKFVHGSPVEDLDSLPMIDWRIFEGYERLRIKPVMTSRGCPFACNFCSVAEMFGRKYRSMSPDRVIADVERFGNSDIFFYDDNLTANKKRAHAIMDGLITIGMRRKSWIAQVRSDVFKDEDLVSKMGRGGCDRVFIGFESVNSETLNLYKKSQTPEDVRMAVEVLHRHGIRVHGMFMYGADSDKEEVAGLTTDFVKRARIDSVQYMALTPFPGTELFYEMERNNRLIHRDWRYYDGLHVVFWPAQFSPRALQQLVVDSFKSFYSLTAAANEVVNTLADGAVRGLGWVAEKGQIHTSSLKDAFMRAAGRTIVNRWQRINRTYLTYLEGLSR